MERKKDTKAKSRTTVNNIIASHQKTAAYLLNAARHFMRAAWFQRMGEFEKAKASKNDGLKYISQANEVLGECTFMSA